jgi:S-adenosylmethionine synthetase
MAERHLFTSESVGMGHPDKLADQISDSVVDALLAQDPRSRIACETLLTTGLCVVAGEITTTAKIDYQQIARDTINKIGYTDDAYGICGDTCGVMISVHAQSPDISQGVTEGEGLHKEQGAGDQGMMFGFACNETPELMPAPIMYAHQLVEHLSVLRFKKKLPWLRPDSKSQVTVEYVDGKPTRVDTVVISTQHDEKVKHAEIKREVIEQCIKKVIPAHLMDKKTIIHVNPTGRFVVGGPHGRRRPHGPQDHRRHLRRHGSSRRRRVLGQGPVEGRPLGLRTRALRREERRRRRPRRPSAKCRSRTPSASPSRSRSTSTPSARATSTTRRS